MNKQCISMALLVSALAMLSGCDMFKSKTGCKECAEGAKQVGPGTVTVQAGVGSGAVTAQGEPITPQGEPLTIIRGKVVITKPSYQEYWEDFLKSDPQAEAFALFSKDMREQIYKNLVMEKLIQEWVRDQKVDQSLEYQKKQKRQRELGDRLIAIQAFQEDILNRIDTSEPALEKFYTENRDKNPVFQEAPFLRAPEGTKARAVQFSDEKQAKDFLEKAQKAGADFGALAKASKKEVKDLGVVNAKSRDVDPAVKAKLKEMEPNSVELVSTGKNQFKVIKAVSKQAAQYAPFAEVKEPLKQVKAQTEFQDVFANRIEELKKNYNVQDEAAKAFFEKEREKQQAELQEKLKAFQAQEQAQSQQQAAPEAPKPAGGKPAVVSPTSQPVQAA
jgi:PPIC-type PPIASE domain